MRIKKAKVRKNSFMKKLFLTVLAEELNTAEQQGTEPPVQTQPEPQTQPTQTQTQVTEPTQTQAPNNVTGNFEDLITQARQEERDKLYNQIKALKKDKSDLLQISGDKDSEIKTLKERAEKAEAELKTIKKNVKEGNATNATVQQLTLENNQLRQQLEDTKSEHQTAIEKMKLETYKEKQIALANGEIIPELVTGNSEEEINTSLEQAKQRYAEIQQSAISGVQMPSAVNPSTNNLKTFEQAIPADIRNMPMAEYAEFRKTAGLK